MTSRKPVVLGLRWRQIHNEVNDSDDDESQNVPGTVQTSQNDKPQTVLKRTLSRMQSVRASARDTLGTLRQKLRTSTRRRKRLVNNASPFTPRRKASAANTPSSTQRRSARIAQQNEDKLYTPFNVDTPSRTPSKIRMGTHEPKRFNFSSPGQLYRDVNSVSDGIRALSDMSDRFNQVADKRTGIRTTPQRHARKPVFV